MPAVLRQGSLYSIVDSYLGSIALNLCTASKQRLHNCDSAQRNHCFYTCLHRQCCSRFRSVMSQCSTIFGLPPSLEGGDLGP